MDLHSLENADRYKTAHGRRQRGYDFERYLFDKFETEGMRIKRPYKSRGEQVDGALFLDGNWYLIEAKWESKRITASKVYAFKGKVEGKLQGTRGLFISWSGFADDCPSTITGGKALNLLFCDAADVKYCDESSTWTKLIREKVLHASTLGDIYWTRSKAEKNIKKRQASATPYHSRRMPVNAPEDTRGSLRLDILHVGGVTGKGFAVIGASLLRRAAARGNHKDLALVPDTLSDPSAVFRSRKDEDHMYMCYVGPSVKRQGRPPMVFVVFLNDQRVVYQWSWQFADEGDPSLPCEYLERFGPPAWRR